MFALKCVLVSHSLVIFGHPLCLYNCFQSFIHPTPWFAVVTRPNWERRSSVGHHTSRAPRSPTNAILRFSRCSVLLICLFIIPRKKKQGFFARLAAVPSSTVMLLFVQLRSRPIRFGLSLEGTIGNLEDPAKSGVDGPCSKVLLVKGKAKPNQP